jgi:hypothetical protein
MDVYNRGQWEFDETAQEQVTRSLSILGMIEPENLYDESKVLLVGQEDGAFISLRESRRNRRGTNIAEYPYFITFHLNPYTFNLVAPDFISVMMFCKEFCVLISERNQVLKP